MNSNLLGRTPPSETDPRAEATAQDVARAAGVSRIMVSRAFNPNASVKADKREHILKVAQRLGYHPDMAARSMVTGRSNLVAVLVPSIARAWESQEVDALITALQRQGMATLLFHVAAEDLAEAAFLQVRAYKPAAVIAFLDLIGPEDLVPMFGNSPAIYPHFGAEPPKTQPGQLVDRLHVNQHAGIRSAVKLLKGTGKRRVAYVAGADTGLPSRTENANSDHDRFAALQAALVEHGMELEARIEGEFDYETSRQRVLHYVRNGGAADAFFAANDISAFGALDALRHDLGLAVPEQYGVVGFDNIREASWRAYDLTTVGVSVEARVAALMRLVKARMADPSAPARVETVTASLIVRSSV
ncbi:LacI family DNA-binding transcriptional regulator [Pelagibacterium xiamenense]|uniref:LacI family DNA-binding transcriptional regulator n=1 Tax=Pelagibacterium xiamenense TaxID=2901140 RepID=UPI001E51EEF3|nr:substrate-binding domain-containing protein [Pelagibacterium xiamenense]MCD7059796.1 substrate-binding domain-containing protein [Pelagibacterium xiamenense]